MIPTIEAIKPKKKAAPSLQETIGDTPADEATPKKTAARGSRKPKNVVKDDPKPKTTANLSVILPPENSELLEVDPNNHMRKRQKTTSPKDETKDEISERTGDVSPMSRVAQRPQRRKASSPTRHQVIWRGNSTMEIIESPLEKDVVKRSERRIPEPELGVQTPLEIGIFQTLEFLEAGEQDAQNDSVPTLYHPQALKVMHIDIKDGTAIDKTPTSPPADSKQKKILHFNPKTGTIGSPPAKKVVAPVEAMKPRSNSRAKQPKSKLVTIRYTHGEASASAIGLQIDQILKGAKRITPSPKKAPLASKPTEISDLDAPKSTKPVTTAPAKPPAALHPFFSGKLALKPSNAKETAKVDVTVIDLEHQEPTSLGRARPGPRDKPPSPSKPRSSAFTGFPGFGASSKVMKFPGAIEPAWPWKDMIHIRGDRLIQDAQSVPVRAALEIRSKPKKSKYQAIEILAEEDIIGTFTADLGVDQALNSIKEIKLDEYPQLPSYLRAPIKHFESGYELQRRIRKELHMRPPLPAAANDEGSSEDEIQERGPSRTNIHPAISKAYASIATSLTAFDQFRYEAQPWTHKNSPRSAAEVLQTGREAVILKEWLQKLTVMSVETGPSDRANSRASSISRRSAVTSKSDPPGKRKRKLKKLDGFIVSSDEEDDMDEISEPEDDISPRGSQGLLKKTVMRASDTAKGSKDAPRLNNAVVISGAHGCGKTAAVYAVAKELGFEVFEINSSSRRSGKDILEKVGDMTRNHLVQRSHNQAPPEPLDEDAQRISDALAEDIKSGRQGTMNSFFKPKDATKPKPKPKKSKPPAKASDPVQASLVPKAPPKQQKQSLILFEEVDVLYEEDKQFWTTVMTLIVQSKRPIIMTCQDESAVPLQSLSLHAILRFTPPPVDLATDYMLLVAANEGHALQRDAVKSLYLSRNLDLRASMTELNFWCQFAVGDVKGGLDWFCPRWPLGCDVDKHGNTIRVVSERTYEAGMGWLSQDFLESHIHYLDIEEETLHQALDGWRLDIGDWQKSIDMIGWAAKTKDLSKGKADVRACLSIYDEFADAMSVADLCSGPAFAPDNRVSPLGSSLQTYANFTRSQSTLLVLNCQTKFEKTTFLIVHFSKLRHSYTSTILARISPFG